MRCEGFLNLRELVLVELKIGAGVELEVQVAQYEGFFLTCGNESGINSLTGFVGKREFSSEGTVNWRSRKSD